MRLKTVDGEEFTLTILGYERPDVTDDYYDSNWLNVRVGVSNPRGSWERSGAFLLAFEVEQLAAWFDAAAVEPPLINSETLRESGRWLPPGFPNVRRYDPLTFIEPDLGFALAEKARDFAVVRIYFELEAQPAWAGAPVEGTEGTWIDLRVPVQDVKAAAQSLRSELATFPVRAVDERHHRSED